MELLEVHALTASRRVLIVGCSTRATWRTPEQLRAAADRGTTQITAWMKLLPLFDDDGTPECNGKSLAQWRPLI